MNDGKVSVLMSVYDGETVSNLNTALKSIKKQSYIPDEVIIVKDGALKRSLMMPFRILPLLLKMLISSR